MKIKHRKLAVLAVCLVLTIPAAAVFNEKNLPRTLQVLRSELLQEYNKMQQTRSKEWRDKRNDEQHQQMVSMIKKCNELALILYSQNQDYTFDVTYALKEATEEYEHFKEAKRPFFENIAALELEIDRYERLIEALRRLPPALEEMEEVPDSLAMSRESLIMELGSSRGSGNLLTNEEMKFRDSVLKSKGVQIKNQGNDDGAQGKSAVHDEKTPTQKKSGIHDGKTPTQKKTDSRAEDTPARKKSDSTAGTSLPDNQSKVSILGLSIAIPSSQSATSEKDSTDNEPFILDEQGQIDRDSCLFYAKSILKSYQREKRRTIRDSIHYNQMSERLKQTYDYARKRYDELRENIFIEGQDNIVDVFTDFPSYERKALQEMRNKYGMGGSSQERSGLSISEWRGPVVAGFTLFIVFYLALATLLSNILVLVLSHKVKRFRSDEFKARKSCVTLLCGVVIFAVTVMIARYVSDNNFLVSASGLLIVLAWLFAAILLSLLIRLDAKQASTGVKLYIPVVLLGLIVMTFRIIFIPNKMVTILLPPILLVFIIWQSSQCRKAGKIVSRGDRIYGWISFTMMVISLIMSLSGYVLMSIQLFIWWLFQLAAIETVTAAYDIMERYRTRYLENSKNAYLEKHSEEISSAGGKKGDFITVTWLFDLVKDALLPVVAILSVPLALDLASNVFDIDEVIKDLFYKPFFNLSDTKGNPILHVSIYKLVLVSSLLFIFKYIAYAGKAFYRQYKYNKVMRESGKSFIQANEVNLTLANNIISIIVWGIYIIMSIQILKIPMGAISIVAAGLATGIGLALKDVLNNFIYGIQLMSGRLRVGDYIDCDGVRGKVESISYQSTQILTLDQTIMAITNTTLFNKNFQNLTKDSPYEFVKIVVGVRYGTDVGHVRTLLIDALQNLAMAKDSYSRDLVDRSHGISVTFEGFGDSSVDIAVKQYVLVEEENAYKAKAREIIYNTLNKNNIEIPFPQRDIYVRKFTGQGD